MRAHPYELDDSTLSTSSPFRKSSVANTPIHHFTNQTSSALTTKASAHLNALMSIDTLAVRHAEDRQIVEEHYLAEMKRAVAQANKADADCDDARRRIKQLKSVLDAVTHKKNSTAAIVQDYKSRLESMMATVEENQSHILAINNRQTASEAADTKAADRRKQHMEDAAGKVNSLEDLRYEAECEERRVMSLRQRHIDSHQLARDVRADLEMLQSTLHRLEGRRSELETVRLQLAALESDAGYRDASTAHDEYTQLMEKVTWQQKELSTTRIEGQSMVMHLIEGAKTRSGAIAKERKRLLDQYTSKHGPMSDGSTDTLNTLMRDNASHRAGLVSVIVNSAAEKEAMEQYIAILSERCAALLKQLREAEQASLLRSPDRMPR